MDLFIDTNIFLSFYHLTNEDLVELEKLAVLIENKEITLLLPQQVMDETRRNRANKINDSFEVFKKAKFSAQYPAYCKEYPQYKEMRETQDKLKKLHSEMVSAIQEHIDENKLRADILIDRLFGLGRILEITPSIIEKAKIRLSLGNPPGKKGSLGDPINWETLLLNTSKTFDLYFIADDTDFFSPLNSNKLNEFLIDEWVLKKKSNLFSYRKLSNFFKDHFPDINLKTELEKDKFIEKLAVSPNFSSTHVIISELSKYNNFTYKQAEDLWDILETNDQVNWIFEDEDVKNFYQKLNETNPFIVHFGNYEKVKDLLEISERNEKDKDEIPF